MSFSPNLAMNATDIVGAFQTTRGIDPSTIRQKMEYDDAGRVTTTPKLVNGRPVFQIPCQFLDEYGVDNNVSLSVFTAPTTPIPPLSRIQLVGSIHPVPWVKNGRIAWSITADAVRVVQIDTAPFSSTPSFTAGEEDDDDR
ncbi:hypothetical protein [Bifidobacterium olomucense]|uniref:Uncharacterized protein n=1 Tax=Bifidobacterium olomucense TaxID=2675324 RepID=A0A7Y0EZR1_9BIFI|nr:hypothetical protein [Bifidobacterium sp. DSM 109959]NMM99374.1 hypothetical protein [Bifidobacterium sp. DSM 109959]